jgi:hypothetical protein
MRSLLIGIIFLLGCNVSDPKELKTIDSLNSIIKIDSIRYDSLLTICREQKTLINFTAQKCHKYASIVQNNPTQSIFIVNWIDRSFQWKDNIK